MKITKFGSVYLGSSGKLVFNNFAYEREDGCVNSSVTEEDLLECARAVIAYMSNEIDPIASPVAAGSVDTCDINYQIRHLTYERGLALSATRAYAERAEKAEAELAATKQALAYEQRHAAESEVALAAEHAALLKAEAELEEWVFTNRIDELQRGYNAALSRVKELEAEDLSMHRKLTAETLRADQGWARYEVANRAKNALEAERACRSGYADDAATRSAP